jgi:hypothetical protein
MNEFQWLNIVSLMVGTLNVSIHINNKAKRLPKKAEVGKFKK